jgi:F-type H+-transporting ATPase subunit b
MVRCKMLELNFTIIIVSALVGLLLRVLNHLYYKPIGQVIEERESKIAAETNQIESNMRNIEEKAQHIEAVLKETQKESGKIREELIIKGEEVRKQLIKEARENSKKMFENKMTQLDEQILMAEKKLEQEIGTFSDKIKEIFLS